MNALDMSVERRLAHSGVPAARRRLDDYTGCLNGLFARHLGRPAFRSGAHHGEVYSATFSTEVAARTGMAWAEDDLSDMRLTPRKHCVVLTGLIGGAP